MQDREKSAGTTGKISGRQKAGNRNFLPAFAGPSALGAAHPAGLHIRCSFLSCMLFDTYFSCFLPDGKGGRLRTGLCIYGAG